MYQYFFSFSLGIIFSVIYFFIYHAVLLRKLLLNRKEIKKLERLLENERIKKDSDVMQNKEMQQNNSDNNVKQEPFDLN